MGLYGATALLSGALICRIGMTNALPMCDMSYYERNRVLSALGSVCECMCVCFRGKMGLW